MDGEDHPVAGLPAAQLLERARDVRHELEYWQHILADATAINEAVMAATTAILDGSTVALELVVGSNADNLEPAGRILDCHRQALDAVKTVSDAVASIVDLAAGRQKALKPVGRALQAAADLELDDDDAGGAT